MHAFADGGVAGRLDPLAGGRVAPVGAVEDVHPGIRGDEPARADAQLRASDADRDAVLAQLQEHAAAGRLTPEELEHRAGQALDDLSAGLTDAAPALLEMGLVVCVLFHAFNGIRLILVDFWSKGPKYQRQMLWVVLTIWILVAGAGIGRQFFYLLTEH